MWNFSYLNSEPLSFILLKYLLGDFFVYFPDYLWFYYYYFWLVLLSFILFYLVFFMFYFIKILLDLFIHPKTKNFLFKLFNLFFISFFHGVFTFLSFFLGFLFIMLPKKWQNAIMLKYKINQYNFITSYENLYYFVDLYGFMFQFFFSKKIKNYFEKNPVKFQWFFLKFYNYSFYLRFCYIYFLKYYSMVFFKFIGFCFNKLRYLFIAEFYLFYFIFKYFSTTIYFVGNNFKLGLKTDDYYSFFFKLDFYLAYFSYAVGDVIDEGYLIAAEFFSYQRWSHNIFFYFTVKNFLSFLLIHDVNVFWKFKNFFTSLYYYYFKFCFSAYIYYCFNRTRLSVSLLLFLKYFFRIFFYVLNVVWDFQLIFLALLFFLKYLFIKVLL